MMAVRIWRIRRIIIKTPIQKRLFSASKPNTTNYDQKGIANAFKNMYDSGESPVQYIVKAYEDSVVSVAMSKYKQTNSKLKIMDVGCGTGSYLRRISSLNIADYILGIDISQKMIDEAKSHDIKDIDYKVMDVRSLVNEKSLHNKFDIINAGWLYTQAKDRKEFMYMLQRIYKCLKPNGIHSGITTNPSAHGDSEDILYNKYGIQKFSNQEQSDGYKPSKDGEPDHVKWMVMKDSIITLETIWYSKGTYLESFEAAGFEDFKLIDATEWDLDNEVSTMNEEEKSLFVEYAKYNPQPILFTMRK